MVWSLADRRPGHAAQAEGLVAALEVLGPVTVTRIRTRLRSGVLRWPLAAWLNRFERPPAAWLLPVCFDVSFPAGRPDAVVSAGFNTAHLNAWLARRFRCGNFFAGSPRGLDGRLFSAVLTLEPVPGLANNLVVDLPPTPVSPAAAREAGAAYRAERGLGDETLWALVVGGDGAGYRYGEADWRALGEALGALARCHGVRWLLTTSRRTGAAGEAALREAVPPEALADAVWWHAAPRRGLQAFLGAAEGAFVTEESMTMVTEAIAAGRPVVALRPADARPQARHLDALARWEGRALLARAAIADLAALDAAARLAALKPLTEAPARILAPALAQALGWAR